MIRSYVPRIPQVRAISGRQLQAVLSDVQRGSNGSIVRFIGSPADYFVSSNVASYESLRERRGQMLRILVCLAEPTKIIQLG